MCSEAQIQRNYATPFFEVITCIKSSRLLLDDDKISIDVHLAHKKYDEEKKSKLLPIAAALCMVAGIAVGVKTESALIFAASTVPCLALAVHHLLKLARRRKQRLGAKALLAALAENAELIRMITYYLEANVSAYSDLFGMWTKLEQVMEAIFFEELGLLKVIKSYVQQFCGSINLMISDHFILEHVSLTGFTINNCRNANDCIRRLQELNDVLVLFTSSYLSCLAMVLCPCFWENNNVNVNTILNIAVPNLQKDTRLCYEIVYTKFDDLKRYHLNNNHCKDSNAAKKLQIKAEVEQLLIRGSSDEESSSDSLPPLVFRAETPSPPRTSRETASIFWKCLQWLLSRFRGSNVN